MANNKILKRILKSDKKDYFDGIDGLASILAMSDEAFCAWSEQTNGKTRKDVLRDIQKTLQACAAIDDFIEDRA